MNSKLKYSYLTVSGFLLLTLIPGCLGYGSLKYQSRYGDGITIQELVKNWDAYNVYYSGYAVNNPSGIMFDPKSDGKTLTPSDRWVKIDREGAVSEVVSWIKINDFPWYNVCLHRIIGPDGESYGFLYTGWYHITAKATDANTLFVFDLPPPPQYYEEY